MTPLIERNAHNNTNIHWFEGKTHELCHNNNYIFHLAVHLNPNSTLCTRDSRRLIRNVSSIPDLWQLTFIFSCCSDINDCSDVVCQHGGTCLDLENQFSCLCALGYTGLYCEQGIQHMIGHFAHVALKASGKSITYGHAITHSHITLCNIPTCACKCLVSNVGDFQMLSIYLFSTQLSLIQPLEQCFLLDA